MKFGEGGEEEDLAVAGVDRVLDFLLDVGEQVLELGVVSGSDLLHLRDEVADSGEVLFQVALPADEVNVGEGDVGLAAKRCFLEVGKIIVFGVEIVFQVGDYGGGCGFPGREVGDLAESELVVPSELAKG